MRWIVIIILACLAVTVLKAAVTLLLILLGLAVLWGVFFRPAETFGFVALLVFSAVLQTHTVAVLVLIGFLGFIAFMRRPIEPREHTAEEPPLLLADHSSGADRGAS